MLKFSEIQNVTGDQKTVSPVDPLPCYEPDSSANGNITTQNLNATGAATAGSAVVLASLQGMASGIVNVSGTYTAVNGLNLQGTIDEVNWITLNSSLVNETTGATVLAIPSGATGAWAFDAGVYKSMRIVAIGAVTGTAVVTMRAGAGTGVVALSTPIPAGGNSIGNVFTKEFFQPYTDSLTPLAGNATYTGTSRQCSMSGVPSNKFRVGVYADQAGTLYIQVSPNGTDWYDAKFKSDAGTWVVSLAVSATTFAWAELPLCLPYVRVKYTNGATIQTIFKLYSALLGVGAA
jgi:hypothetical protein